jgi:hypothetical protein
MNVREFHAAIVAICRAVSGEAADDLIQQHAQQLNNEALRLSQETDLLLDFAHAFLGSGVRGLLVDAAGTQFDHCNYCVDSSGRIEGRFFSVHELAISRALDRLNGLEWWFDEQMEADMRSELVFADGSTTSATAETAKSPFVANRLQQEILAKLDGRALDKQALADEVCKGEGSRLYARKGKRKGDINELMDLGLVCNKSQLGYYRPDRPPEDVPARPMRD